MYQNKRFVALIPARKGSKGILHKNTIPCAGKPLIHWTFQAALSCPLLDAVYCSSDDPYILQLAKNYHVSSIRRPVALAQDNTPMIEVLLHAKQYWQRHKHDFDYVVLLQPTSPLRTAQDIQRAIQQIMQDKTDSLASMHPLPLRAGLLMQGEQKGNMLRTKSLAKSLADVRRQESPTLYYVNGAVYIWKMKIINPNLRLNSPQSGVVLSSVHTVDIDTLKDLHQCEQLFRRKRATEKNEIPFVKKGKRNRA